MDLNQAGAMPGRTESFYNGVNGTPNMIASGLAEQSAKFNDKVGASMLTPHSVLQGLPGMSGNGMSEQDAQRKLPGGYQLPSQNGISSNDYEAAMRMRLMGNRGEF